MSTETGTLPIRECKTIADGHGISGCPLHLAASKLFDALTNLANMAILLGKMQRAGMIVSPEMLEVLADHCKVARDALAQTNEERQIPPGAGSMGLAKS